MGYVKPVIERDLLSDLIIQNFDFPTGVSGKFHGANSNNRGLPQYKYDIEFKVLYLSNKTAIHNPWLGVICVVDELSILRSAG
jgi:hypothetical protein